MIGERTGIVLGGTPRERYLEAEIERLSAELNYWKSYSERSHPVVAPVDQPAPIMQALDIGPVLRCAAVSGYTKQFDQLHVFVEVLPGYCRDHAAGYYVTDTVRLARGDAGLVVQHLYESALKRFARDFGKEAA